MTKGEAIEFWFDFSSGYAYFAHLDVAALEESTGYAVVWRPYMLGAAFKVTGAQGLSHTPVKGDYARRDWQREARRRGVPFNPPPSHPVVALGASRIFYGLDEQDPDAAIRFARAAFRHIYALGEDVTEGSVLVACCDEAWVSPAAVAFASEARLKLALIGRSEEALAKGVFGSPFFLWRGEPFWGVDRMDMLKDWIREGGW